ncbi:cell cycle checkpoint control protein RAD9B [Hyla sarda]|uniref:cell cycle checkpoint control protein RAD9B n=1 Tax=Hyla sarda TaxID=327740 RepID=UPI0024C2566A|nr:cell cycle checkpoint control protein RAD9B [Hyla sarda]
MYALREWTLQTEIGVFEAEVVRDPSPTVEREWLKTQRALVVQKRLVDREATIFEFGDKNGRQTPCRLFPTGCKLSQFRYLGVEVSSCVTEFVRLNLTPVLESVSDKLQAWSSLPFSLAATNHTSGFILPVQSEKGKLRCDLVAMEKPNSFVLRQTVFGKAIHSLSRIGDELWFDPLDKGLALRVVNTSRSAYACIFFSSFFFHSYQKAFIHEQGQGHVPLQLNLKFSIKTVLPVFRSLSTLDRNVEKCHICYSFGSCHMVFQLFYKKGLTKTYNLTYEDCEPIQAVYSKSLCPNVLKIQSRAISDIVIHFPSCQEEVTLSSTPNKIILKSYSEENPGLSKCMQTEIHLGPDEFNDFQINIDSSDVTFCLKEFRGFLSFAEATSAVVTIYFSKPGEPIIFSIDDMVFEANLVLATLEEMDESPSQKSHDIVIGSTPLVHKARGTLSKSKDSKSNKEPELTASPVLMTETAAGNSNQHTTEEPFPTTSYNKFCSLFFGAVSTEQQDKHHQLFYSLATASEDEDEGCCRGLSQTF